MQTMQKNERHQDIMTVQKQLAQHEIRKTTRLNMHLELSCLYCLLFKTQIINIFL